MFKWRYEKSVEVNIPIGTAWGFYSNPSNWPKWVDRFESCHWDGELKAGSVIKGKIVNRNIYLPILITEIKPGIEYKTLMKVLLFTQETVCSLQEIHSEKTMITNKIIVTSLLTPFMNSFFLKGAESQYSKSFSELKKIAAAE